MSEVVDENEVSLFSNFRPLHWIIYIFSDLQMLVNCMYFLYLSLDLYSLKMVWLFNIMMTRLAWQSFNNLRKYDFWYTFDLNSHSFVWFSTKSSCFFVSLTYFISNCIQFTFSNIYFSQ